MYNPPTELPQHVQEASEVLQVHPLVLWQAFVLGRCDTHTHTHTHTHSTHTHTQHTHTHTHFTISPRRPLLVHSPLPLPGTVLTPAQMRLPACFSFPCLHAVYTCACVCICVCVCVYVRSHFRKEWRSLRKAQSHINTLTTWLEELNMPGPDTFLPRYRIMMVKSKFGPGLAKDWPVSNEGLWEAADVIRMFALCSDNMLTKDPNLVGKVRTLCVCVCVCAARTLSRWGHNLRSTALYSADAAERAPMHELCWCCRLQTLGSRTCGQLAPQSPRAKRGGAG